MHSLYRSISNVALALAIAVALFSTCLAQEVASVDLTKIERGIVFRKPKATLPIAGGHGGSIQQEVPCPDSAHSTVALRASLQSLYQIGGRQFKFEVTVENTSWEPIRIPSYPQLADLQPKDPAQKFSYSQL